jgi:hypothetical protein
MLSVWKQFEISRPVSVKHQKMMMMICPLIWEDVQEKVNVTFTFER